MKSAFQRRLLPSKTGLVSIVNGRVLIRPPVLTATFTANLFRWPAIATDSLRDVFLFKSTRYGGFSIAGDSPRRTSIHSHSIINKPRKSAWLKGLALIDIGPYRRFYRQGNTPFPGAGLRGIGSSSISFNHTEQGAELHPLASRCDSAYESFFRPIMRCDAEPKWLPLQRKT